jgi:hypothetical protein
MKTSASVLCGCALFILACTDIGPNDNQLTNGFAIYKLANTTISYLPGDVPVGLLLVASTGLVHTSPCAFTVSDQP